MFWVIALVFYLLEPALFYLLFRRVNAHLAETEQNLKDMISPLLIIFYWLYYAIFQLLLGLEIFSKLSLDAIFFKWLIIVILSKAILFLWFISGKVNHKFKSYFGSIRLLVLLSIYGIVYVGVQASEFTFTVVNMESILSFSKAILSGLIWVSVPLLVLLRTP